MNLYEETAKMAYELYEKSGCIGGREHENWVNAEKIVLMRHASQDIEAPERQKIEPKTAVKKKPVAAKDKDIPVKKKRTKPAKAVAAKDKKVTPAKAAQKSRKKSP